MGSRPDLKSIIVQKTIFSLFCLVILVCNQTIAQDATVEIHSETIINDHYIGNGAQWDPYQLDYGEVKLEISDEDWEKLYARLDFMRPQLMRVVINIGSYVQDGELRPDADGGQLLNILNYCNENGITVLFGDWGWDLINGDDKILNKENITYAARLADYLINEKGFEESLKYFNIINEPNGYWASTEGSYELWSSAAKYLHEQFEEVGISDQISIVGPDVAIWTPEENWWIDSTATDLGEAVGLYDIHTYPSKVTVNSGEFYEIVKSYKDRVPNGKKIVMGEIGFKFVEDADSLLNQENVRRAEAKEYASVGDSQMFVYDYIYGTDMADALFQTVNAGYSGSVVWMLDDAMYSLEEPHKLKVWGFWNIFGEEYFGAEEENVRPWYYAWSLLSKYMPAGSQIFEVTTDGDKNIKAIALQKGDQQMVALVNVGDESRSVQLRSDKLGVKSNMKKFIYSEGTLKKRGDHQIVPNSEDLNLDFGKGISVEMPSESLIVYTNFSY